MSRPFRKSLIPCALLVLGTAFACGEDQAAIQAQMEAEREAALVSIEEAKEALDAKRAEYHDLLAEIQEPEAAEGETPEPAEGETAEGEEPLSEEELQAQADELKEEIETEAEELAGKIVEFINEDPPVADEPYSEHQQRAINLKVEEDILLAQQWVQSGGDYRRAISILESLVPLAPNHEGLQAELEQARNFRYMTEERFAAAKKGMTEDEIREALGPVNLRNVKEYDDRGVIAWFYPKDGGGAAGVFFNEKKGQLVVYKTDYNAVPNPNEEEGGEGEG
ncbi:MAG: hypothetical protein SX243_03020 [Acidobacteriota bacterium]|nr:hypothetical protein [Acidobacteriota bacterium]